MQDRNDFHDIPDKGVYYLVFKNRDCTVAAIVLKNIECMIVHFKED
ncbi:hypothetical protein [Methanolobus sp.]|nr:hypothetical protein [Methanolobus sp.]